MAVTSKMKKKLAQRREELASKGGGNYKFFTVKEGTTRFRTLPTPDDEEFAIEVDFFYLGGDIKGVISPATFGERCAIMEAYEKLKNGSEDDQELANTFKPKKRYLSPHIKYLDDKGLKIDEEAGAKLFLLTNGQYQEMIDLYLDDEQGDFQDPVKGYDLKHKRTGKGQMDTEYKVIPCKPTKLAKKYRKVYDPEKMVREIMPNYDQTKTYIKSFLGSGSGKKSKGKKEKPSIKGKKKSRKGASDE